MPEREVTSSSALEVEELVVKLAKEGIPPSRIGLILRDQHAIPKVRDVTGKTVLQILESRGLKPSIPEDLANVIRKAVRLYKHMERYRKDMKTKRALEVIESRINRLARYYKRKGTLPKDWRYDRERAALLVK
jgi:small subunit ribosomal protein S15